MSGMTCLEARTDRSPLGAAAAADALPAGAQAWLRRGALGLVLAFLVLGGAVRCRHYFAGPSYWYDEAYLLVNIFNKNYAELCGPLRLNQAAPPLFLWTLRSLYLVAGSSEWAMRLPSLLASLLAMVVAIPLVPGDARPEKCEG